MLSINLFHDKKFDWGLNILSSIGRKFQIRNKIHSCKVENCDSNPSHLNKRMEF